MTAAQDSVVRRTLLYVPGNNPSMMVNASVLGADVVVLDIEDAVSAADKDAARILIRNALYELDFGMVEIAVRINDTTTPYWQDDLRAIVPARPNLLVLPKIERPQDIIAIDAEVEALERENGLPVGGIKFGPILETALGIENAYAIAQTHTERLFGLLVGGEDLVVSLHAKRTRESLEILYPRLRCVVAARASGIPPLDTVYPGIEDIEGLVKDTAFSCSVGFAGRCIISPRHVAPVNEIFSPSEDEIRHASEIVDAIEKATTSGRGVGSLYGKMIDAPVVARARQVLSIARRIKGW